MLLPVSVWNEMFVRRVNKVTRRDGEGDDDGERD